LSTISSTISLGTTRRSMKCTRDLNHLKRLISRTSIQLSM